jgi:hypothetical protein
MAEIGLVAFATDALEMTFAAIPNYRSKFSKRLFTQPQLLSILCLMQYEDWTFREAEVQLSEHSELRRALQLDRVPDFSTLHRFLKRITEPLIAQIMRQVLEQFPQPLPATQTSVAVDSTGLAPGAISTFFVKRARDHGDGFTWRHRLKWTVAVDIPRRLILAQVAHRRPTNDCAKLRPLVKTARQKVRIAMVLADAEFDSERNHQFVRQVIGTLSIIPAKRGKRTWKIKAVRAEMGKRFPRAPYRQTSLVESVFSAVKRKLSARAPGRSIRMQRKQALLLGLAYDIYRF